MLDRELIRKQPDLVRQGIVRKKGDASLVDQFLSLDAEFRRLATETGNAQAESNAIAKAIGAVKAAIAMLSKYDAAANAVGVLNLSQAHHNANLNSFSRRINSAYQRFDQIVPNTLLLQDVEAVRKLEIELTEARYAAALDAALDHQEGTAEPNMVELSRLRSVEAKLLELPKSVKGRLAELEAQERVAEENLRELELEFPNLPHATVPDGKDETENPVIRTFAEPAKFDFEPKPHWDIADQHKMIDLARGAKITGSGWVVYTGIGAKLQRALFNFMVDFQTEQNGYDEIYPPFVVNRESLIGTGNLPKFEDDLYKTQDDFFLIPTAEVPVTNLYRDEILEASQLPIRHAAFSGCFRREAGAAGKDTRGLLRIHQFDKVEMVKFVEPAAAYDELESMVVDAESILQALGLHYRVIELCTGDMGPKATKIYDVEVWAPGVGKYLEVSSVGNFGDYQSRRANIRYRPEAGAKPEFVHILNGSGVAVPRLMAALLETYQQADGSVQIPEVLRPYVGREKIG